MKRSGTGYVTPTSYSQDPVQLGNIRHDLFCK